MQSIHGHAPNVISLIIQDYPDCFRLTVWTITTRDWLSLEVCIRVAGVDIQELRIHYGIAMNQAVRMVEHGMNNTGIMYRRGNGGS
jgi:hypothetical protein